MNITNVVHAAAVLREAQKANMAVRNDDSVPQIEKDSLGLDVASASAVLDTYLAKVNPNQLKTLDAILDERLYQMVMAASDQRPDMVPVLSVGEGLLAIHHNLSAAQAAWYTGDGDHPAAMQFVRKVGALALQLGESHGMPVRMWPEEELIHGDAQ